MPNAQTKTKDLISSIVDVVALSKQQGASYFLAGIFIMVAERFYWFYQTVINQQSTYNEIGVWITDLLSTKYISNLGTFALWFLVGIGIYVLFWIMIVFIIDFYNNIVFTKTFVHPKSFHKSEYWLAVIGRYILRIAASGFFVIVLIFALKFVLPQLFILSAEGFSENTLKNILKLASIPVATLLTIHACVVLLRVAFLRRRLVYDGEPE